MANARKKLEAWLRSQGYVTSRDGIDFDRAADALGIGRRSLIRYLNGDSEVPAYLSMLVDAREAYTAERAIIVRFRPLKSDKGRGTVVITLLEEEDEDMTSAEFLIKETKMTFVEAMERARDEADKRGCKFTCRIEE